jgi:hypothetical protein
MKKLENGCITVIAIAVVAFAVAGIARIIWAIILTF